MSEMFAKRHYEAIAELFQQTVPEPCTIARDHHELLIARFAGMLRRDNPRFDTGRFIRACVPGANVRAKK